MFLLVKTAVSGLIIALASTLAKKYPLWGAVLVSIPITSLLTALWLHIETGDNQKIAAFLGNVFWAHLPTLVFFIITPYLLRAGHGFWLALVVGLAATTVTFFVYARILREFGINIYE